MNYTNLKIFVKDKIAEHEAFKDRIMMSAWLQEYCDFPTHFIKHEPFNYFLLQNVDQIKRKFTFEEYYNARSKYLRVSKKFEVRDLIHLKGFKIKSVRKG